MNIMAMRLTPDQEALVQQAIAKGVASTPEDVVTAALRSIEADQDPDLPVRAGMSLDQLNRELDKGLEGQSTPWEGAEAFHERMLAKHRAAPGERS